MFLSILIMPSFQRVKSQSRGESLIEVLLVIVVLASIVALMVNLPNAMMLISKSKHLGMAREIATKQLESKRQISFDNLANDDSPISDPGIALLPQGNGTVVVEDCGESICTNSEEIKKVTVTINWIENNKNQQVILSTLIGQGGLSQ